MDEILFLKNLKKNYKIIKKISKNISGKHKIDDEKSKIWINSQLCPYRKKYAQILIENTHYITFESLFKHIKSLIIDIYKNIKGNTYFYIQSKTDSVYFISITAIHYVKKYYGIIPGIIFDVSEKTLKNLDGDIIIIDDFIYSGNKLKKQLEEIYLKSVFINKMNIPSIHIGVVGMTEESKQFLKFLNVYDKDIIPLGYNKKGFKKGIKNPVNFYKSIKIESLPKKLGDKGFFNLLYYFAPYNYGNPIISLYFDHKIADSTSTFLRTLIYGPILPSDLKYDSDDLDSLLSINTKSDPQYLIENVIKNDEKNKIKGIEKIKFVPFIENCNKKLKLKNLEYHWFVMSNDILNENMKNIDDILSKEEYLKKDNLEYENTNYGTGNYFKDDILKNIDIVKKLQNPNDSPIVGIKIKIFYFKEYRYSKKNHNDSPIS